ncbi:aminoglycoside phosphotransferase family protein [Petralouisia muris]|uniref:Aminoglycoside phosphotransferase family protein n=1 Tax=Petralouisia muris TaxID=3032872 RepID=A0AC61S2Q4_9FIRM|nr:aminoglycoside phosphotransferase family protein [Petralouisia muris]TGY98264.1 aminoglycoside phosphotransferase family protein [Petralouisia muris]
MQEQAKEAVSHFELEGIRGEVRPFGSGHINDTFLVEGEKKAVLQRMNRSIFSSPEEVMENIVGVTEFLKKKIAENGGDVMRETLTVIPARDGKSYYLDSRGEYWRMYYLIENAISYDRVEREEDFYESALSFGNFQQLLADYPAETLHETIPGFHDTKARYEAFLKAVDEDVCGRAKNAAKEIEFFRARKETACVLGDMLAAAKVPLRVTHNDTKLNNIMIDEDTRKGICVIDLDTVMPGLAVNDFGDAIRFGASTGEEDERDLSKVSCDLRLFRIYTEGFLKGCKGNLTDMEIAMLPMGAKVMTYENGIRFLTDYLKGDVYFKIHREGHNLDRCRTQMKLMADMEEKWEQLKEIVREISGISFE